MKERELQFLIRDIAFTYDIHTQCILTFRNCIKNPKWDPIPLFFFLVLHQQHLHHSNFYTLSKLYEAFHNNKP